MISVFKFLSGAGLLIAATVSALIFTTAPVLAIQNSGNIFAQAPVPSPYQIDISPLPQTPTGRDRVTAVLTIVFGIVGALSLLFITIGGFRYILSEGDPQAAAKAKGTIIYALVGLVVSISAVAIVTFVLGRI